MKELNLVPPLNGGARAKLNWLLGLLVPAAVFTGWLLARTIVDHELRIGVVERELAFLQWRVKELADVKSFRP